MRFGILGPFEVADDEGRELALGGRKQRAVLAILLLHAGEVVSSDRLIDELWRERPPATAAKTVQVYVSKLRNALGDGVLITRAGGYLLDIKAIDIDVGRFQALVGEAHGASQRGDPRGAAESLRDALALWRGPALSDFAYEPFAQGEIARLDEARLVALENRIDAELELGEHALLVGELEALVLEHPLRERMHGQLMLALYRAGRQADALDVYQRARTHLADELGLEPGPALRDLQAQILDQAPGLVAATQQQRPVARLPLPATPTIGREREVKEISGLLTTPGERLVTLTGTGGVGKTRLALVLAHALRGSFVDGVFWVELAGLARAEDVASTIARGLEVTPAPGESSQQTLCRELAHKRLLLVLDNFEHVLDATEAIGELLRASGGLTILVTSREALNLSAEHRVLVGPLSLPEDCESTSVADIGAASATALFLAAALRRQADVTVTPESAPVIAQVCARLDGLPLALELAAARAEVLGIEELAARLASLAGLGTGPRDAPARQRTLSATIDWSYHLLDQQQRTAFTRFAVFAGGATIDAAEAVTGASLETLEALSAKSLLARRASAGGTSRLIMLETVREYAAGLLQNAPAPGEVHRHHAEHYRQFVEQVARRLATPAHRDALAEIDREMDNIRAALRWSLGHAPVDALRLAGALGDYWFIRGDPDGLDWLDEALRVAGEDTPPVDRARVQLKRSRQLETRNRQHEADVAARDALGLYREIGDLSGCSTACCLLTLVSNKLDHGSRAARAFSVAAHRYARLAGDDVLLGKALERRTWFLPTDQGMAVLDRAADLLANAGDDRAISVAYNNMGWKLTREDRADEGLPLLERALRASVKADSVDDTVFALGNQGWAYLFTGNHDAARAAFAESLQLCVGHNFQQGASTGFMGLAALAARDTDPERAAQLHGVARTMGYFTSETEPVTRRLERAYFAPLRARYGDTRWREAERTGAALSYEDAITYALQT